MDRGGALLTALTVVRELEQGSMGGPDGHPPQAHGTVLGKTWTLLHIGMFDMAVVMAMGSFSFKCRSGAAPCCLIALAAIFLIATLGQGLLISVTSENQLQAFQMAMLTRFCRPFFCPAFRVFHLPDAPAAPDRLLYSCRPVL